MFQRSLVAIVIVVSAMAPFARFFQIVATGLRLATMFTMLALRIVQLVFRVANPFLALSVVIAIKRPRGNCSAQE